MALTREDRRRIMDETRARMEASSRYSNAGEALEPQILELARRVLDADQAQMWVRAMLVSLVRETGSFDSAAAVSPAEAAHAIARDDDERDALIDALVEGARAAEDDWLALGAALVRFRYDHPIGTKPVQDHGVPGP